jgi:RimJ/RimL family protein N-acetyltransferase
LLEGKNVDLRIMERDDVDFATECFNNIDFLGEFDPIGEQTSRSERMKLFDNPTNLAILIESKHFVIQKKEGTKIGFISHWVTLPNRMMEIGYNVVPSERGKGYGTEATQILVDYLFLSQSIDRVQAITDVRNKASQTVLERTGFRTEGTIRKSAFVRGKLSTAYLYSILREEWKEPRILTKTK